MNLFKFLKHIGNDNRGATAVEYGLIVSLIVIAMAAALQQVANSNSAKWNDVQTAVEEVTGG